MKRQSIRAESLGCLLLLAVLKSFSLPLVNSHTLTGGLWVSNLQVIIMWFVQDPCKKMSERRSKVSGSSKKYNWFGLLLNHVSALDICSNQGFRMCLLTKLLFSLFRVSAQTYWMILYSKRTLWSVWMTFNNVNISMSVFSIFFFHLMSFLLYKFTKLQITLLTPDK